MNLEDQINKTVAFVEEIVVSAYEEKWKDSAKPPLFDPFKASMLAEIARRIRARAVKVEEDWEHFTRS